MISIDEKASDHKVGMVMLAAEFAVYVAFKEGRATCILPRMAHPSCATRTGL